ncbi:zinc finger protein ZAT5 [Canna indica]|uniref:Zinc finger protein ZAT5 n=1 Tax=Canna indica TaxID=4628 RepID=A0AAQ3K6S0_9LILI|nr:zinc finger protein ZAT5 [Canna indica]
MEEALKYSNNSKSDNDLCVYSILKGKRTKRRRFQLQPSSASPEAATSSTSSLEVSSSTTTDEEEDMANCLILLAQGRPLDPCLKLEPSPVEEKYTSRKFTMAATTTTGKAGFYVYQCKTCGKCFPSFQALGGHRTSHKKPKVVQSRTNEKKPAIVEDDLQIGMTPFSRAVGVPNQNISIGTCSKKAKLHECSVCGSEFSSGQALGGHMRRHRSLPVVEAPEVIKKEKNALALDLNVPAQADDDSGDLPRSPPATVGFFESNRPLVFSAPTTVDCHIN